MEPFKRSKTSKILYRKIPRGEYSHMYQPRYERTFLLIDDPVQDGYHTRSIPDKRIQEKMLKDLKKGGWDIKYILPPFAIELNEEDKGLGSYIWEVDFYSVGDEILNEVDKAYFKPTMRRYMNPNTREHFKDIF
jgi:hypothetical protein